jgi:hypothetical protein
MQVRRVRVQIETARQRVVGIVQLPTEGYRSRTTDFLNAHDSGFIALTDAEVTQLSGGESQSHEFVAVGARHITVLMELEDLGTIDDLPVGPLGQPPSTPPPGPAS